MTPPDIGARWERLGMPSTRTYHERLVEDGHDFTWSQVVHALRAYCADQGYDSITAYRERSIALPTPTNGTLRPDYREQEEEDNETWNHRKQGLADSGRWHRFVFISDQHRPYHDHGAVALALEVARVYAPDVVIDGGDFWDFGEFRSTSEGNARFNERWPGGLVDAVGAWQDWRGQVREAAPGATHVILPGNHDYWLWKFLETFGGASGNYTLNNFVYDVRSTGALWMGIELDELELSPGLVALHGLYATKVLETTSRNTLDRVTGRQASVVYGHTHREGFRRWPGRKYDVSGYGAGCHTDLKAHYSRHKSDWTQGCVIGHFNPNGPQVVAQHVSYVREGSSLVAYVGSDRLEVQGD